MNISGSIDCLTSWAISRGNDAPLELELLELTLDNSSRNQTLSPGKRCLREKREETATSSARLLLVEGVFGALVLCIKPTSSLPVLQIPILHYEINYD